MKTKSHTDIFKVFLKEYEIDPLSEKTKVLAEMVRDHFKNEPAMTLGDARTPLTNLECQFTATVGAYMAKTFEVPDIIFVSPYVRTYSTLEIIKKNWKALEHVKVVEDERIREQEHGIVTLYPDWKVFLALHPEQKKLYDAEGKYYYRFPQGENVPDVRQRVRSFVDTIIRDFAEQRVLVVTHHLTILSIRAQLERLDEKHFLELDEKHKPINSGLTFYTGDKRLGADGKLVLKFYNKKYY